MDGFYGILMGCKEFYGILVEFIKEWDFHGNLTGFSGWMLDVGCWVMHGLN